MLVTISLTSQEWVASMHTADRLSEPPAMPFLQFWCAQRALKNNYNRTTYLLSYVRLALSINLFRLWFRLCPLLSDLMKPKRTEIEHPPRGAQHCKTPIPECKRQASAWNAGFPKLGVFWRVRTTRTAVFWSPYSGSHR